MPSISPILPRLEEIKMTFALKERSGNSVWNMVIGSRVLASKCVVRLARDVEMIGLKEDPSPAFRTNMLTSVILFAASVSSSGLAAVSGEERESVYGLIRSLLPGKVARVLRSVVNVSIERMVAITVVLGRRRRDRVRPRPSPNLSQKLSNT